MPIQSSLGCIPADAHVVIIGSMKCGTSSLYDYLAGHPAICPCVTKEPEFFSENQGHGYPAEAYHELFHFDVTSHQYTLEASTGYSKYPMELNVPKNMFDYGISPKLIYIIRDPFMRIESQYNFWHAKYDRLDILDDHLISLSSYSMQLDQYRQYFADDQILLLDFDDLKQNPQGVLRSVYDYLRLPHSFFPNAYHVTNKTEIANPMLEKLLGSLQFTRHLKGIIPLNTKLSIKSAVVRTISPSMVRLTSSQKDYVYSRLKQDMHRLYEVYGFDVTKWGFTVNP
jgi:hypothetical protein